MNLSIFLKKTTLWNGIDDENERFKRNVTFLMGFTNVSITRLHRNMSWNLLISLFTYFISVTLSALLWQTVENCIGFLSTWNKRNSLTFVQSVMSMVMQYCFLLHHSLVGTQLMIAQSWWDGALEKHCEIDSQALKVAYFSINTRSSAAMWKSKWKLPNTLEREIWLNRKS